MGLFFDRRGTENNSRKRQRAPDLINPPGSQPRLPLCPVKTPVCACGLHSCCRKVQESRCQGRSGRGPGCVRHPRLQHSPDEVEAGPCFHQCRALTVRRPIIPDVEGRQGKAVGADPVVQVPVHLPQDVEGFQFAEVVARLAGAQDPVVEAEDVEADPKVGPPQQADQLVYQIFEVGDETVLPACHKASPQDTLHQARPVPATHLARAELGFGIEDHHMQHSQCAHGSVSLLAGVPAATASPGTREDRLRCRSPQAVRSKVRVPVGISRGWMQPTLWWERLPALPGLGGVLACGHVAPPGDGRVCIRQTYPGGATDHVAGVTFFVLPRCDPKSSSSWCRGHC